MGLSGSVIAVWNCPTSSTYPIVTASPCRGLTHMVDKILTISGLESMLRSLAISWTLRHEVGCSM
jgi:hypothetical protein